MGKIEGANSHPLSRELLSATSHEKFAVAALDHGDTVFDQTDRAVSQRGRLPSICGNARRAVHDSCDLPVTRAGKMAIRSLQHEPHSPALLRRETSFRWQCPLVQRAPEARDRFYAVESVGTEVHNRGARVTVVALRNVEPNDLFADPTDGAYTVGIRAAGLGVKFRRRV
jgi:hypothetical protein